MQKTHGGRGDQRRLLGGLRHDRVSGRERPGHLSGKDREREIPRRDGGEHATSMQRQDVPFTGRPRQILGLAELHTRLGGVVPQEIDGLAQITLRVHQGLSRLAHQKRHQLRSLLLEEVRRTIENVRARRTAHPVPVVGCGLGRVQRRIDGGTVRPPAGSDDSAPIMR